MKKTILILFLIIFTSCCTIQSKRYAIKTGLQSLVYIEVTDPQGRRGLASGCVLNKTKGYILTNKHVAPEGSIVFISNSYGKSLAGVVFNHKKLDISIVKVMDKSILRYTKEIEFTQDYFVGDTTYIIGNPYGMKRLVTTGIISKKSKPIMILDADINFGNSGGLVINEFGYFIGLVFATDFRTLGRDFYKSGFSYAIDGMVVKKEIDKFLP